jgi:hypothetical protein
VVEMMKLFVERENALQWQPQPQDNIAVFILGFLKGLTGK